MADSRAGGHGRLMREGYPTKYPPTTASFQRAQDRGNNAHRQILLSFPETMDAGTEAGEGDSWGGAHSSETRHDHLFANFSKLRAGYGFFLCFEDVFHEAWRAG
jgi:hypothetical protein